MSEYGYYDRKPCKVTRQNPDGSCNVKFANAPGAPNKVDASSIKQPGAMMGGVAGAAMGFATEIGVGGTTGFVAGAAAGYGADKLIKKTAENKARKKAGYG